MIYGLDLKKDKDIVKSEERKVKREK